MFLFFYSGFPFSSVWQAHEPHLGRLWGVPQNQGQDQQTWCWCNWQRGETCTRPCPLERRKHCLNDSWGPSSNGGKHAQGSHAWSWTWPWSWKSCWTWCTSQCSNGSPCRYIAVVHSPLAAFNKPSFSQVCRVLSEELEAQLPKWWYLEVEELVPQLLQPHLRWDLK